MDKILKITLLYDFYGELLTDKQKTAIELHYLDDLSLAEIGVQFGISRQAVADMIKRSEKILMQYEEKLLLVDRHIRRKKTLEEITKKLDLVIDKNKKGEYEEIKSALMNIF
ncbi:MAG: putative DNA-binding protein [Firmicutes bacterium]|nr:putative DNA-binding protein [Bacillota bacterium]